VVANFISASIRLKELKEDGIKWRGAREKFKKKSGGAGGIQPIFMGGVHKGVKEGGTGRSRISRINLNTRSEDKRERSKLCKKDINWQARGIR